MHGMVRRRVAMATPVVMVVLVAVAVVCGVVGVVLPPSALAGNLHLVEALPNGFALYRSGKPDRDDVEEYCRLGIEEMCVLSGNAADHELRYRQACPMLAVVYDVEQDADVPVDRAFLEWFDAWVGEAREQGKRIAVRCNCGCHRTGRLIAYYQMRYQNLTTADALLIMYEYGENWGLHRNIEPQVRALRDYLVGRGCTQKARYCVREGDGGT
jgi:hypothetical protein